MPVPAPEVVPPAPPPVPAPAPVQPQPATLSRAASGAYDRRDSLPAVNVYLPEGQASVRLRKLIRNVLFESQIDYKFVNGDISTFLRYKYYATNFTYRLGDLRPDRFPEHRRARTREPSSAYAAACSSSSSRATTTTATTGCCRTTA